MTERKFCAEQNIIHVYPMPGVCGGLGGGIHQDNKSEKCIHP